MTLHQFKYAFYSFIHAISTEVRAWRHFSLLVEQVFLQYKEFKLYWGAVLRCVHSFFNDLDLSKPDKNVMYTGHEASLEATSGL